MRSFVARAVAGLGLIAVIAGLAPAAGALVDPPRATASLDVHQALAGTQQAFTLTVGQPATGLLTPVRSVKISAPAELFTIAAPTNPPGWTGTVSGGGSTLTYKATGAGIAGGSSQAFTFLADTLRPATDLARSWAVSTSTDAGTATTYRPVQAAAGALGTRVRTLEILGIAVTSPAPLVGDPTLHVTAGQADVGVAVRVSNAGAAPQTASVALAGATATASAAAPVEIDAGAIATVPFDVAFGDVLGHGKLVANATAGESVAGQRFLAYVADEPVELALDPDNLTPEVVVPGRQVSFSNYLAVRGDEDAVAVDLDPVASAYRFADGALVAPLGAALHLEPGGGQWLPPTPPVTVPALADGPYAGVLHLEGTDAHGGRFVADLPMRSGSLVVDSLAPIAGIVLGAAGQVATDNTRIPLSGTIEDRDGACGDCALTDSAVQLFDADGALLDEQPFYAQGCEDEGSPAGGCEAGWTNEDGTVGGFVEVLEWPTETVAARLVTDVVDDVGLASSTATTPVEVDLVAPAVLGATTVDPRTVDVQLSEPVSASPGFAPGDWSCDGRPVPAASTDGAHVLLSLGRDLSRNATPTCAYAPVAVRAEDRAGLPLADETVTADDGIAPLAPVVDTPAFVNTATPTLSISDLQAGDTVSVFEDGFLVGSGTADGPALDVTTDSLGTNDRVVHLLVSATDGAGNVGPATPVDVTLDFTAPALAEGAVEQADRQLTVTFAEPLVGPDAVDDWSVGGPTATGPRQTYTLGSADVEGAVVTLTVADPRFAAGATLDEVGYEVLAADGSTRLTDRAGNVLPDAHRSL